MTVVKKIIIALATLIVGGAMILGPRWSGRALTQPVKLGLKPSLEVIPGKIVPKPTDYKPCWVFKKTAKSHTTDEPRIGLPQLINPKTLRIMTFEGFFNRTLIDLNLAGERVNVIKQYKATSITPYTLTNPLGQNFHQSLNYDGCGRCRDVK